MTLLKKKKIPLHRINNFQILPYPLLVPATKTRSTLKQFNFSSTRRIQVEGNAREVALIFQETSKFQLDRSRRGTIFHNRSRRNYSTLPLSIVTVSEFRSGRSASAFSTFPSWSAARLPRSIITRYFSLPVVLSCLRPFLSPLFTTRSRDIPSNLFSLFANNVATGLRCPSPSGISFVERRLKQRAER